jgi:MoxR-like ATPase
MMLHRLVYPTPEEEKEILRRNAKLGIRIEGKGAVATTEFDILSNEPVGSSDQLVAAMQAVQEVYVSEAFIEHIVEIVNRTRNHPLLELGCSPRAGISLIKASRARALIHGRHYVVPDDLYALADDVILHRCRLNYEALADGHTGASVLQSILREFN